VFFLPTTLKERASASWPRTEAKVESGIIRLEKNSEVDYILLEMAFSYIVLDAYYGGIYSEGFTSEESAQKMLQSFRAGPLFVRYKPTNPAKHFFSPYTDLTLGKAS
jgi:hypothetical protein